MIWCTTLSFEGSSSSSPLALLLDPEGWLVWILFRLGGVP